MIAHFAGGDLAADFLYDARTLMAEDHGQRKRQIPGLHRDIGMAQPTGAHPDPHIVGSDGTRGELGNFNRLSGLVNDRSFH